MIQNTLLKQARKSTLQTSRIFGDRSEFRKEHFRMEFRLPGTSFLKLKRYIEVEKLHLGMRESLAWEFPADEKSREKHEVPASVIPKGTA